MNAKRWMAAVFAVVLTFCLWSCVGGGNVDDETKDSGTESETTTTAPDTSVSETESETTTAETEIFETDTGDYTKRY